MATANGLMARPWNGVEISRRVSDGYVNATAMCKAGRKRWPDYVRLDRTQDYLFALATVVQIPTTGRNGLIQTIQGGRPELQGTWVHPRLAVDLARWIAPAFAVWMDGWFLEEIEQHVVQHDDGTRPTAWWRMASEPQKHAHLLSVYVNGDHQEPGIPALHRQIRHHAGRLMDLFPEPTLRSQLQPVAALLRQAADHLDQIEGGLQ